MFGGGFERKHPPHHMRLLADESRPDEKCVCVIQPQSTETVKHTLASEFRAKPTDIASPAQVSMLRSSAHGEGSRPVDGGVASGSNVPKRKPPSTHTHTHTDT